MNAPAPNATGPLGAGPLIQYEQPLSERMRTFLRLEFLADQARHHAGRESAWSSRAAINSLIEILTIVTRSDVRGEVLKELERQGARLSRYASTPGVDRDRLEAVLGQVAELRSHLNQMGANYTQVLKDSEFLAAIRHRSAIPGGTCEFDLPDFKHWLTLPHEIRQSDFEGWFGILRPLCEAVEALLWMTRESGPGATVTASRGMFQHAMDRSDAAQLVRIGLPENSDLFPEVSGGQHRFTIRFLGWTGIDHRPVQVDQDVDFLLACC